MLSGRYWDPEQRLLLARARLYLNRIEFTGLALNGKYRRLLWLENVKQVDWRVGQTRSVNLILWLRNGEVVRVWMNSAGLWKYQIDANIRCIARMLPEHTSDVLEHDSSFTEELEG